MENKGSKHIYQKIAAAFLLHSKALLISFNMSVLLMLCWFDVVTGDYSLIIFYLIPVSVVAWFVGMRFGIFFCLLAIAARIIADEYSAPASFSHAMLHYWNELMEFIFLLIMSILFSTLRKNLENEKTLSSHDPLTGALNRRSFFDLAEYEINRSRRYDLPFTVVYIDLDKFKDINDNLGHRTGDKVLITVVATIKYNMRSTDILARFGGDEFVILLPETSGEAATVFLYKMHSHLNDTTKRNNWPVTFSIGAATFLEAPQSIEEVIQRADELMYSVKHSGKNGLLHRDFWGGTND